MSRRPRSPLWLGCAVLALWLGFTWDGAASSPIHTEDLREWLTYIASDQLKGRALFSDGLGLAAQYIEDHLQSWRVKPAGDRDSFFQMVMVQGVKTTSRSTVIVQVGGESRTFKDGDGITFPKDSGRKRTLTIDHVEFVGYGLDLSETPQTDPRSLNVSGAAVVWLGTGGSGHDRASRRLLNGRSRYMIDQLRAAASIGPHIDRSGAPGNRTETVDRPGQPSPDFTTSQHLDNAPGPTLDGDDAFFKFLFSRAPASYDELKRKAGAGDKLPTFRLEDVTITVNVDMDYQVVRTQLSQNIDAIVEGSDPQLRNTYVAFGAHYDHVGYADSELTEENRRPGAPGFVTKGAESDRIWNGADDDGSGTVAMLALAKAFSSGPRPKRSVLFVWHTGEERGLYGSRYFVDNPTVPLDSIVTELNIDMIGRNRDNDSRESNTVYVVGSDRISSELHEINQQANRTLHPPLVLNYEMNDPREAEQVYTRSDHYSYAVTGIPIIFFTTGLHPDYHANTDEVSKIVFDKMTRVVELIYETGLRVANLEHPPARDNKGPRAGRGQPQ